MNVVVFEDKLNGKTAHFRLPSMAQKRRVLKLPIDGLYSPCFQSSFVHECFRAQVTNSCSGF